MTTPPIRFETLIEGLHDEIYRYIWRMLRSAGRPDSAHEAEDLTQETFLRAFQAFKRLRPGSNQRAWLYKIATHCAYSALKVRPSTPLGEETQRIPARASQSPERQASLKETLELLREAIADLPPKQRAAVVLRHVQGLDYAEVAQVLCCSEDSARANVYQGLRRLRRTLPEELAR